MPPLKGIWASERITRPMIRQALERRGIDAAGAPDVVFANPFVEYIVYEITVSGSGWTEREIPDGLPWDTGFRGSYVRVGDSKVVARGHGKRCDVTLKMRPTAVGIAMTVVDDTCGERDRHRQIAIYEAAQFHRVGGAGAPSATLATGPSVGVSSAAASSSRQRLRARPLGSVSGAPMGYLEYLPPDYRRHGSSPLLVALHGSGQSGPGTSYSMRQLYELGVPRLIRGNRWPDRRPFVVLAPQHTVRGTAVCITPAEIRKFLRFAVDHYGVDPARIYLTGLSCGAIGAWNYFGEYPTNPVAAAVLISGGGYGAIDLAGCAIGRVPIWAFHGARDDIVPARFSINSIARLQDCTRPKPVDARLTLYPRAGHDAWTRTYDSSAGYDIYRWLLRYTN